MKNQVKPVDKGFIKKENKTSDNANKGKMKPYSLKDRRSKIEW
jgi:hypothetical protein